jgi:hypothetical protein
MVRIRIRIKLKSRIRIRIKRVWIRNIELRWDKIDVGLDYSKLGKRSSLHYFKLTCTCIALLGFLMTI